MKIQIMLFKKRNQTDASKVSTARRTSPRGYEKAKTIGGINYYQLTF